jgi:hypothetical protein
MNDTNKTETITLPLWKNCLAAMRDDGIDYGKTWQSEYFEQAFRTPRDTQAFVFEMMSLRNTLEKDDGYYLKQLNNGAEYMIQTAVGHEDEASRFDRKVRTYAVRSVNLRSATLMNPKAELSEPERAKMEKGLEIASTRLVLMARQKNITRILTQHAPKLLEKKTP